MAQPSCCLISHTVRIPMDATSAIYSASAASVKGIAFVSTVSRIQCRWLCGQVRPVRLSATLCPSSHPAASHSARPTRRPAVARLRHRERPPRSGSISLLDPGSSPAASRTVVPRYGGTYAERNIAFEFYFWLSPDCELYLEFQLLKDAKSEQVFALARSAV